MIRRIRAPKKEIFGWAMFDFANQAFITVVFGDLFTRVIVGDGPESDFVLDFSLIAHS